MVTELLPFMYIGHVELDQRTLQHFQGVGDPVAVMGPCSCVDHDAVIMLGIGLVDLVHHFSLVVGLEAGDGNAQLPGQPLYVFVDLI